MRIVLIGCSKKKHPYRRDPRRGGRVTPRELYAGQLFRKQVEYAERQGVPWMVLSARFGLWRSNVELNPTQFNQEGEVYDTTMADLSAAERAAWHASIVHRLIDELWEPYNLGEAEPPLAPAALTVEIHAGKLYAHPLAEILTALGVNVRLPCKGLGIGQQLALYTSGDLAG